jgi:ribosomal protein L11 methyltransferase
VTPDRWLVLHLPVGPDPELRDRLVALLMESAWSDEPLRGVEERTDGLVVYLPPPERGVGPLVERLKEELRAGGASEVATEVHPSWQPQESWADHWRRGFGTRRITPRIVVTPSWEPFIPTPGQIVLTLDPGMAFGTAEHATTRGCLRLLDGRVLPGSRVADVGAGSGILSIAAARLGAAEVLALELDPWACTTARENVERNDVSDRVRVVSRGVGPTFVEGEAAFHGIVANIETPILRPLLGGFARGLVPGGWLILSGILESEAPGMIEVAAAEGFRLEVEDREAGWWSAAFTALRPAAAPPA